MAVYIAVHKDVPLPREEGYVPLQVGAAVHPRLPYCRDDTGIQISAKNPHYCELTGLFWIWHNTADSYKGLVHYRRFFAQGGRLLTEGQIRYLLRQYDILLPRPEPLRERAWEEFCLHSGFERDLVLTRMAVAAVSADMLPAFDAVMASRRLHLYNMLVASEAQFNAYCRWLFAVLTQVEQGVDMTGYTPYQQRLYGFLGERLLNVWVAHRCLRVCALPVKNTELTTAQEVRLWMRRQKNRLLGG
ncbi:MAG: DUF4422 domain-containing protein [Clostridia bacterium]|nr:DUF4422 domain-containing protein [Clostridia bacterium]